jgi:hypothetical protein
LLLYQNIEQKLYSGETYVWVMYTAEKSGMPVLLSRTASWTSEMPMAEMIAISDLTGPRDI